MYIPILTYPLQIQLLTIDIRVIQKHCFENVCIISFSWKQKL